MRRTRAIAVTVVLVALQVVLLTSGRAAIPLAGLSISVAFIPALAAGILEGGLAGLAVGTVFGLLSLSLATTPLLQNPIIALVPRLLIGGVAAIVYGALRRSNETVALVLAGSLGAIVNTGVILGLAVALTGPVGAPYVSPATAWDVARSTIPAEAVLGALSALILGHAVRPRIR